MAKYEKCSNTNEQSTGIIKKWNHNAENKFSIIWPEKNNRDIAIKVLEITSIAIVDSERNLHELHINLSLFYIN